MADGFAPRDYTVGGPSAQTALERGLVNAAWYRSPVPRARLKQLLKRSNGRTLRDTAIWLALFLVTGGAGAALWGSWWAVPFFAAYGVLWGSSSDSRWHECGHYTAFETRWMNDLVYHLASFMILREPTVWRRSHQRHHTDTIIVGRDPELPAPRPPNLRTVALSFLGLPQLRVYVRRLARHAAGRIGPEERSFIPEEDFAKVHWEARAHIAAYLGVAALAAATESALPFLYVGLPSLYGAWLYVLTGLTQHAGLAEDVLDHRLNTRTVYMNPVVRFLYWNMNYHVEHHMFPMVPFHALPALHEEMKSDTPRPYAGFLEAYREIVPTLVRQVREPGYFAVRKLPEGAGRPEAAPAGEATAAQ